MNKPKVAFVCVHNSCRSQMAEALGNALLALNSACKALGLEAEEALHAACEAMIARFAAAEESGSTQSKEICQFLP